VRYSIQFYCLQNLSSSPNIIVVNDWDKGDLFYTELEFTRSCISLSSTGTVVLKKFEMISNRLGAFIGTDQIKSGDLLQIYENDVLRYSGYVIHAYADYNAEDAHTLVVEFDTLLSHFTRQNMVQSFANVETLLPVGAQWQADFSATSATVQNLLQFMLQGSIYAAASNLPANGGTEAYSISYLSSGWLSGSTQVYYYPNVQATKEQVLLNSLFLYQVLVYQDYDGGVVIGLPSANNKSNYNITDDITLINARIESSEAAVANNVVFTMGYYGWFPQIDGVWTCIATPNQAYFPRSSFLYTSKYFSQVELAADQFQSNIMTDPKLLELAFSMPKSSPNVIVPGNTNNTQTAGALLASRYLAQALSLSGGCTLLLQRTADQGDLPINQVVNYMNKPYYCVSAKVVSKGVSEREFVNTIELQCVPMYSITGAWEQ